MRGMVCSQCGQRWLVDATAPGAWQLRESPDPWVHSWTISAEVPCCPFDGGDLTEARKEEGKKEKVHKEGLLV